MSEGELAGETQAKLSQILRAFAVKGRSKLKSKPAKAQAILQAAKNYVPPTARSELKEFIRSSFLKPLKKTKATAVGSANEANVLIGLPAFTVGSTTVQFQQPPQEAGLAVRTDKRWLASSVDGISKSTSVKINDTAAGTAVEVKTMTTASTINEAKH